MDVAGVIPGEAGAISAASGARLRLTSAKARSKVTRWTFLRVRRRAWRAMWRSSRRRRRAHARVHHFRRAEWHQGKWRPSAAVGSTTRRECAGGRRQTSRGAISFARHRAPGACHGADRGPCAQAGTGHRLPIRAATNGCPQRPAHGRLGRRFADKGRQPAAAKRQRRCVYAGQRPESKLRPWPYKADLPDGTCPCGA